MFRRGAGFLVPQGSLFLCNLRALLLEVCVISIAGHTFCGLYLLFGSGKMGMGFEVGHCKGMCIWYSLCCLW
jgi:hypothetical protein